MRVICLSCGHKVEMGNTYDDYEGRVRCVACGTILAIKTEDGKLKSVDLVKAEPPVSAKEV